MIKVFYGEFFGTFYSLEIFKFGDDENKINMLYNFKISKISIGRWTNSNLLLKTFRKL